MGKEQNGANRLRRRGRNQPRSFWESIVEDMLLEDLTYAATARRHGVSQGAVANWARKLGRDRSVSSKEVRAKPAPGRFVELLGQPCDAPSATKGYQLTLSGGVQLTIPSSVCPTDVITLVSGLARQLPRPV